MRTIGCLERGILYMRGGGVFQKERGNKVGSGSRRQFGLVRRGGIGEMNW